MAYDDLLRKVHGKHFERRMFIVYFINGFPNALFIASIVLVMYTPDHCRCTLPDQVSNFIHENPTVESTTLDYFIPYDAVTGQRSQCERYNRSADDIASFLLGPSSQNVSMVHYGNATTITCDNGHTFTNPLGIHSISVEFDWTCENAWKKPTAMTIYIVGKSVATASGFLSDRYGRRIIFIASTFLLFGVALFQSVSTSSMMYMVATFFSGVGSSVNFISGFVLAAECTTPERRNFISISGFVSFSIGYAITTIIFYFIPTWKWCLRAYGIIGIFYIFNLWLVPESPRWLMAKGRVEEAKRIFKMIAKCNKKSDADIDELLAAIEEETVILNQTNHNEKVLIEKRKVMKNIFKSPTMLGLSFVASYSWFSIAMVYYGITFGAQALSGNIFVNNALLGLVELPGMLLCFLGVKYLSRPVSHGGVVVFAGVLCIGVAYLSQVSPIASTAAGLLGKSLIAGAFYMVYMHTAEVFPTVVRNTCMGLGSFSGRIGSMVAPYFAYMIALNGSYTPFVIMGLITVSSGILTLFVLPETLEADLPETVEESLALKRLCSRICRRRTNGKKTKHFQDEVKKNTSVTEMI